MLDKLKKLKEKFMGCKKCRIKMIVGGVVIFILFLIIVG